MPGAPVKCCSGGTITESYTEGWRLMIQMLSLNVHQDACQPMKQIWEDDSSKKLRFVLLTVSLQYNSFPWER